MATAAAEKMAADLGGLTTTPVPIPNRVGTARRRVAAFSVVAHRRRRSSGNKTGSTHVVGTAPAALDAAGAAAYRWRADIDDEDALRELLRLNLCAEPH